MLRRISSVTMTMLVTCLVSPTLFGQAPINSAPSPLQRSLKEVGTVLVEANGLADKMALTKVRSEAANLLWSHDTEQARDIFLNLWQWIGQQEESGFDRDLARTEVIKELLPRDQAMANKLLQEVQGEKRSEDAPLREQLSGKDANLKRLNQLASELLEVDANLAAKLLEQSLSVSVSPGALGALTRLREKDWTLADNLALRTIDRLRTRPDFISLPGIYSLLDYAFPMKLSGEKLPPPPPPGVFFGRAYFNAAYEILKKSLSNADTVSLRGEPYTEKDRAFRAIYQGQTAAVLALLAARFGPERAKELTKLAETLASQVPPAIAPLLKFTVDRLSETPAEMNPSSDGIAVALAKGDVEKANQLLDKLADESVRKSLRPLIINTEFKSHLAKGKLVEAFLLARKIDDSNVRTYQYLQVAKGTRLKGEGEFGRFIIHEAFSSIADASNSNTRAHLLFSLAAEAAQISQADSLEILEEAVGSINLLSKLTSEKTLQAIPLNQKDGPRIVAAGEEFSKAFSTIGLVDLERVLHIAQSITDMPIRLAAKLKACELVLTKSSTIPKASDRIK